MANIPNRRDKFNTLLSGWDKFYGEPIDRIIVHLRETDELTFQQIADLLYKGEVSRCAIQMRYHEIKKKGGEK